MKTSIKIIIILFLLNTVACSAIQSGVHKFANGLNTPMKSFGDSMTPMVEQASYLAPAAAHVYRRYEERKEQERVIAGGIQRVFRGAHIRVEQRKRELGMK